MKQIVMNKQTKRLFTAIAALSSGIAYGQNYVDISLTPTPAAFASNSTDTFAQTLASSALNAAGITPNAAQANALQSTFDVAVAGLNGDASVLGSAANYQAARAALDANPASAALQADLARSQAQYSTFNTTITNLSSAATITSGTSINTFSGVSGATLASAQLTASGGAISVAKAQADASTQVISDAISYFKQGAGASTTASSFADLEGGVIEKIQPLNAGTVGAGALDYTVDGFRNQELDAYNTATTALGTAQTAYAAAIGNPASTAGDIAAAAGTLAAAETAYATSVQNLYTNGFAPITDTKKNELLGAVLNGSWERDAIKSNTTAIVANADAITTEASTRAAADAALTTNLNNEVTRATGAEGVLQNNINAEATTRAAADATLTSNLNNEVARATTAEGVLQTNINSEAAARAAADATLTTNLNNEIATRAAADSTLTTNLNNEVARATAAEGVLQANINTEASIRAAADSTLTTNLNNEVARATAAEGVLQTNINTEAATRASEDTLIRADIAAEAATRSSADTQLQANITAETNARIADVNAEETRALAAEAALGTRIDTLSGRVDGLAERTGVLEGRVDRAEGRINSLRKGIAMAAALQTPVIEQGKNNALKAGVATIDGAQGFGIAYARRVNASVQVNLDVATDFATDAAARAGVNYSF